MSIIHKLKDLMKTLPVFKSIFSTNLQQFFKFQQ